MNNKLTDDRIAALLDCVDMCDDMSIDENSDMAKALLELQERRKAEVPGYPETLPCPVFLEPGLKFGKGVRTQFVLDALRRRADYYAELEGMTPEQRAKHDAGIDEFKAMLQGSQPVSNRDELQVIGWLRSDYNSDDKRDPNAPLFMLGSNDPSEAWGVKYIPLSGNSPVIPDGWKLAPEKADESMIAEGNIMASCMIEAFGKIDVSLIYGAMLAAAPEKEVGPCTK